MSADNLSTKSDSSKRSFVHGLLGAVAKNEYEELLQRYSLLSAEHVQLQQVYKNASSRLESLATERDHLISDKAARTDTINRQLKEIRALNTKVGALQDEIRKRDVLAKKLSDTIEHETVSIVKHNYGVNQLKGEIHRLQEALTNKKQYIEKETVSTARHNYDISQLKSKVRELTRSLELCKEAGKSVESQRAELKVLEDRKKAFCDELNGIVIEIGEKAAPTGRPAHAIATLVAKVRGIRTSLDELNKQRARMAAENEGLERKIEKTSTRLLDAEDSLAKRKSACEEKRVQVKELQAVSSQLKTKIRELESTFAACNREMREVYERDMSALAGMKQAMLEEIECKRKEQEATLPEARLRDIEIRDMEATALYDDAERKRKSAESRLTKAKEEAQQIREQAEKILQRARAKSKALTTEAEDMLAAAKERQRDVIQQRRELGSMPNKVDALSDANKRMKAEITKLKQDLRASAGGKSELTKTIREMEREIRQRDRENEKLTEKLGKERERGHELAAQVKAGRGSMDGGFLSGYQSAQEWMLSCGSHSLQHKWSRNVVILGSGPFPDHLLDKELGRREHIPCLPGVSGAEVMIVGRDGCAMSKIEQHIRCMEGEKLRIYSQEMAVLAMITGTDPFDAEESVLMEMGRSHPILSKLIDGIELEFQWPLCLNADSHSFDGKEVIINLPDGDSPLAVMGYCVGWTRGLPEHERRHILSKAFRGKIPNASNTTIDLEAYMKQWGRPMTNRRLWRIAKHLSGQIAIKRRNPTMKYAVDEWISDLKWLKDNFYGDHGFGFSWPGSSK